MQIFISIKMRMAVGVGQKEEEVVVVENELVGTRNQWFFANAIFPGAAWHRVVAPAGAA